MGQQCCSVANDNAAVSSKDMAMSEAQAVVDGEKAADAPVVLVTYQVTLDKANGSRMGLDVDYMAERRCLPIMGVTGGLAELWNKQRPDKQFVRGDSIIEVNGVRGDVPTMLDLCKTEQVLNLTLARTFTYEHLLADLEKLITSKKCGPILIRFSWHDAGVYSKGELTGGCPNAAMRFVGEGEAIFPANAGLPTVALNLLEPITKKYCPDLISHADLWTLAANVAIRVMGGPDIHTHFGRIDAKSAAESVASAAGRLPDGDKGADHLRQIFGPKGFSDKDIVALSGAHTVGRMRPERSGFDGVWTEDPYKFDNSYFKDLLTKTFNQETSSKGLPQLRCPKTGTVMLISDMALVQDASFKTFVTKYAEDQAAFFQDFTEAWVKLQENGCNQLRELL